MDGEAARAPRPRGKRIGRKEGAMADVREGANGAASEKQEKPKGPSVQLVDRMVIGEKNFESEGYAYIKRTVLDEKRDERGAVVRDEHGDAVREPVVRWMKLPIQSAGVREVIDRVERSRPKPTKTVVEFISGDTEAGRRLGVPKGKSKPYRVDDLTDDDYKEKLREHERQTMYEVINQGLVVAFVTPEGKPVPATEALLTMKLSLAQFTEIQDAIEALTRSTDAEREAFTGRRSTSETTQEAPTV